jgi:ferric-dicitrate binding protein FerR (iron transport regulator)
MRTGKDTLMNEKNARLQHLLNQYLAHSLSEVEKTELWGYINDPVYELQVKDVLSEAFEENTERNELTQTKQHELLRSIYKRDTTERKNSGTRQLWPHIAAAAAIGLILFSVAVFYFPDRKSNPKLTATYTSDVGPGKAGATLTLANGKKIKLSGTENGQLAEEAGVKIKKTADGQVIYEITAAGKGQHAFHTLSTANGETYQLSLPDGSKVWLNSASSLTYTTSLKESKKRMVRLTGEAYFEIARDKSHPFIVKTDRQEVEVLGTHFNVNSYSDEPFTATTLLEGSVKVSSDVGSQVLEPGEQSAIDGLTINVHSVNTEKVIDWKNGDFVLNNENFKTALRKIARWYDVEIIYDSSIPDDIESGGWISRKAKLSAVLKSIESTGQVRFRIEGKKIYVSTH